MTELIDKTVEESWRILQSSKMVSLFILGLCDGGLLYNTCRNWFYTSRRYLKGILRHRTDDVLR
jgi:hypothetical protein